MEKDSSGEDELVDGRPGVSQVLAGKELLAKVFERLAPDERYLAELRSLGRSWEAIASELDAKPDGLRMRLSRALDRVATELSL